MRLRWQRWIPWQDGKITGLRSPRGYGEGDGGGGWQNERNAKRARPVVTWKGPQWLSAARTHLIRDLISHPVTNQHAGATTRDVRFEHFYPRANNKAVNVIDTDKGEAKLRLDIRTFFFSFLFFSPCNGKRQRALETKANSWAARWSSFGLVSWVGRPRAREKYFYFDEETWSPEHWSRGFRWNCCFTFPVTSVVIDFNSRVASSGVVLFFFIETGARVSQTPRRGFGIVAMLLVWNGAISLGRFVSIFLIIFIRP